MPFRDGTGPRQQSPNPSRRGGGRRRGNCFQNLDNFKNIDSTENVANKGKTEGEDGK